MSIRRELAVGDVLYRQGDPPDGAWLVEHGAIELIARQGRRSMPHGRRGPGELVGELGMLDGAARIATATAIEPTVLLAVEHDQFLARLDAADPIVRTLVNSLLHQTRSIIASLPPVLAVLPATPSEEGEQRSGIDKIRLEAQLRDALDNASLEVQFQPVCDLREGRISGYEALVRWQLEGRGEVSPEEFIHLAEETSLILPVGEYVLDRAIKLLQGLRAAGVAPLPDVAVNVSARQLLEPGMAQQIVARLGRSGLPPGALKLEITESRMLDHGPVAGVMRECRSHGVRFALDDFGTGYSNLAHVSELEFEFIKIDQVFAQAMLDKPRVAAIVEAVVAMAHAIGAEVICEGIESPGQLQRVRALGVRYVQGFLVGRARTADAVLADADMPCAAASTG